MTLRTTIKDLETKVKKENLQEEEFASELEKEKKLIEEQNLQLTQTISEQQESIKQFEIQLEKSKVPSHVTINTIFNFT